jgi:hypothetical protein
LPAARRCGRGELVLAVAAEDLSDLEQRHVGHAAIGVLRAAASSPGMDQPHVKGPAWDWRRKPGLPQRTARPAAVMNDQATPDPFRARRARSLRVRSWMGVSTGAWASPRSNGVAGYDDSRCA